MKEFVKDHLLKSSCFVGLVSDMNMSALKIHLIKVVLIVIGETGAEEIMN